MMVILAAVRSLNLPDCWVAAGFVRSKIWDTLHGFKERTPLADIDVIYFDRVNVREAEEKRLEEELQQLLPHVPWSVKNEARMHVVNGIMPYVSSTDAISKFPESATALGLRLDNDDELRLVAPHGVQDLLRLEVKPTPQFSRSPELMMIYKERIVKKNWEATWSKLIVHV